MSSWSTHRNLLLLTAFLAALTLTCCERLVKENKVEWWVEDPLSPGAKPVSDYDRRGTRDNAIYAPAKMVADLEAYTQRATPLPAQSLLRVELRILPPVNCDINPQHNHSMPQELGGYPERMDPKSLSAMGDAILTRDLWIVPGRILRNSGLPVNRLDRATHQFTHDGPSFNFGPFWLGTPLRQAGVGRWVYFPATQNCAKYAEDRGDNVPTNLFDEYPRTSSNALTIPPLNPVIARVVEMCPLYIEEREEHLRVLRRPDIRDLRLFVDNWRYTGQITGRCASGDRVFTAKSRSILDKPWDTGPWGD